MFNYQVEVDAQDQTLSLPSLSIEPYGADGSRVAEKFDMSLIISDKNESLAGTVSYNPDLFEAETIVRFIQHYELLLAEILKAPDQSISGLRMITDAEYQMIVKEWNQTAVPLAEEVTIHSLIEAQARKTPQAIALSFDDQNLTFQQLDEFANQLAHRLIEQGVSAEEPIGLLLERSPEMIIGILAILKVGAAYVPLEPSHPPERICYQVQDAQLKIVLTLTSCDSIANELDSEILYLDQFDTCKNDYSVIKPDVTTTNSNLAYVIYTSGSTGTPKGVAVAHRSVVNLLTWMQRTINLNETDVVLFKTPFSFDVSVWQIFWPLMVGARMQIAKSEGEKDVDYLKQIIKDSKVTVCHFGPAALSVFLSVEEIHACGSLRHILTGGESLSLEIKERFYRTLPSTELHHLYGPTETTVDVSYRRCSPLEVYSVEPIGRPIANTQLYILDSKQKPVPIGVVGDLYVGGMSLSRGYWHRPELTKKAFIETSFREGERLYKTGDLARFRADGQLVFMGRADQQVKVRGYRIELEEIEAQLMQYPALSAAAVGVYGNDNQNEGLVAYLVVESAEEVDRIELEKWLSSRLPSYMIPQLYVELDRLPLNQNGKLDRQSLPIPSETISNSVYVAPQTEVEKELCEIWQSLLPVERVGVQDNFFELGGHSLVATRVISRIRKRFKVELPVRALFENQTVNSLANRIENTQADQIEMPRLVAADRTLPIPVSFSQLRLWIIDRFQPGNVTYNMPLAVKINGEIDLAVLEKVFKALVVRHESLRTTFYEEDGEVYQRVRDASDWSVVFEDLRDLSETARQERLGELVVQHALTQFDLVAGPLFKVSLVRLSNESQVLMANMHHIISDGWSVRVLLQEMVALYFAFSQGGDASVLPSLPIQYADYAAWQRNWLQGEVLEEQLTYWKEKLAQMPSFLRLPTDRPRPAMQTFNGAIHAFELPEGIRSEVEEFCQAQNVTPYMVLLGAYQLLMSRYSGQDDICVGTPIAGRSHVETENLIGFFVNGLPMRTKLDGNPSVKEYLARVKETALGAFSHQSIPIERILDEIPLERDPAYPPLVQVAFALQN
ncbi:MAG TPA: non-ribosomal peptide synthetase, partial [Gammaproteobacteria bacterium]|nr:non-ribosomal peptide synthetase [Gammaproteobacteria bacterium]